MAETHVEQTEPQTSPAPQKHAGPGLLPWVIVLPLLYLLSSGPALRLGNSGILPSMAVNCFYAPLFICASYCPPFGNAFYRYLKVCGWQPMFAWTPRDRLTAASAGPSARSAFSC